MEHEHMMWQHLFALRHPSKSDKGERLVHTVQTPEEYLDDEIHSIAGQPAMRNPRDGFAKSQKQQRKEKKKRKKKKAQRAQRTQRVQKKSATSRKRKAVSKKVQSKKRGRKGGRKKRKRKQLESEVEEDSAEV